MESDDLVLVIVNEEDEKFDELQYTINYKQEDEIIVKTEKEVPDDDFEYEYLEDADLLETLENLKSEHDDDDDDDDDNNDEEYIYDNVEDDDNDDDYNDDDDDDSLVYHLVSNQKSKTSVKSDGDDDDKYIKSPNVRRRKPLKPSQYKSFVKELKKQNPKFRADQRLLVETLAEIMRSIKVPKPPENCYTLEKPSHYACSYCNTVLQNRTSANRHFQEKHGSFYLVCYACGLDFRCTLQLYRHEKLCRAPDASIVLKARALSIGSKARGRPFINYYPQPKEPKSAPMFSCSECSATFTTKAALVSHENLHKGLRPYRCEICQNAYTSKQTLYRHSKMHIQDTYICDICKKHFKSKATITEHMNTHRPVKRFQCEECKRRYAHKAALLRHVDKVHKMLPPPCVCHVCNNRFMRMSTLKKHMLKSHGCVMITRNTFQKKLPKMTDSEFQSYLNLHGMS